MSPLPRPSLAALRRFAGFSLVALTGLTSGQPAVAAIDPELWVTNGTVHALEEYNGTLYLAGEFTELARATGGLAPFDTASAALAPNFPRVNGVVHTVIEDGAGGWYIGGSFTEVGGLPRQGVAQVDANLVVTNWQPQVFGTVHVMRRTTRATVLVGGSFTLAGGATRFNIAELDLVGDPTPWQPIVNGAVYTIEDLENEVLVGGDFTQIGGQSRNRLGSIVTASPFGTPTAWNPNANGIVHTSEVVPRADPLPPLVIVGGAFTTMGGQARGGLAQFEGAGVLTAWNPGTNGSVHALEYAANRLHVGGAFTTAAGQSRARAAAIDAVSGAALVWNPGLDDTVQSIVADGAGGIYLGGTFTTVSGQPIRRLSRVTADGGSPLPFAPNPNDAVHGMALGGGRLLAGGRFTGTGGVVRHNVAAIDRRTGEATAWAPDVSGPVYAFALEAYGLFVYTVHVGGAFATINGVACNNLGAIDALSGNPTGIDYNMDGPVHALAYEEGDLYVGGAFTQIGQVTRYGLAAVDPATGQVGALDLVWGGSVHSLVLRGGRLWIGGDFAVIRNFTVYVNLLAYRLNDDSVPDWNPAVNGAVRAIAFDDSTVHLGGEFSNVNGQSRIRYARVRFSEALDDATLLSSTPDVNMPVRALAIRGGTALLGGDFSIVGGLGRFGLAAVDLSTHAVLGIVHQVRAPIPGFSVRALLRRGDWTYAGGHFRQVDTFEQAHLFRFEEATPPFCLIPTLNSPAGTAPHAIAAGEFHGDGIPDLVVCDAAAPQGLLLRGTGTGDVGDGLYVTGQVLDLDAPPMHAATGDFDANGFLDVAFTTNPGGPNGHVTVFLNDGVTLAPLAPLPLHGRVDGLAISDLDQDGILDLAVCLLDSAGVATRGGLEVLRGVGTAGVWDGTFEAPTTITKSTIARRVAIHDFNFDGVPDFIVTGTGSRMEVRMGPGLVRQCALYFLTSPLWSGLSGVSMATGDIDEDGDLDLLTTVGRRLHFHFKNANLSPPCTPPIQPWFTSPLAQSITLPSTPRDLALFDANRDGILDLYLVYDSLGTMEYRFGNGTDGVGDGTFGAPGSGEITAWNILVGDFEENGSPDLVVSSPGCGVVSVLPAEPPGGGDPPMGLALASPNGGELWPELRAGPYAAGSDAVEAVVVTESLDQAAFVHASPAPPPRLASTQAITWTKGAGIHLVDVEVSRDGGARWQSIATRVPGTSIPWIVTPPATTQARVRVVDGFVASRLDASDGDFTVESATTDVPETDGGGLPAIAAFALRDANPARGPMRFRLDVPKPADVAVDVYDVTGRLVQTVAEGRRAAGRYDLVWNARDSRGAAAGMGVYFVRGRVGAIEFRQKVVLVR